MNKKEVANCDCWDVSRFSVFQLAAKETEKPPDHRDQILYRIFCIALPVKIKFGHDYSSRVSLYVL